MVWSVASWNVNSLRTRFDSALPWWDATQPDVLLLQETKVEDGLFPHDVFAERGLHVAIHGQKSYNGVAIVSKHPLVNVLNGFAGDEGQARVIAADVLMPNAAPVRVASVYVPNGSTPDDAKFAYKERFISALTRWAANELGAHGRVVIGGDFNISRDQRDVDEPEKRVKECMFTPEEQQWLRDFMAVGLTDALRLTNQDEKQFTWWDYRAMSFVRNKGMRIDYNFIGPDLVKAVRETVHHRDCRKAERPSDHVPVQTIFEGV